MRSTWAHRGLSMEPTIAHYGANTAHDYDPFVVAILVVAVASVVVVVVVCATFCVRPGGAAPHGTHGTVPRHFGGVFDFFL